MGGTVNETLIRAVVEKLVEQAPHGGWDQRQFVNECGTAFCFAGWALRLSGYGVEKGNQGTLYATSWFLTPEGDQMRRDGYCDTRRVEDAAAALLGLDAYQAWELFYCFTEDLETMLEKIEETTGLDLSAEKGRIK